MTGRMLRFAAWSTLTAMLTYGAAILAVWTRTAGR